MFVSQWRYPTADELIYEGRSFGIGPVRNAGTLQACVASPAQTFDGAELYPEVSDKASIVAFNIAKTYHPFMLIAEGQIDQGELAVFLRGRIELMS